MDNDRRSFVRGEWLRSLARQPIPDGAVEIASMIVHARPEHLEAVAADIRRLPQVEIAARDPLGKLVVTVEAGPGDRLGEILTELSVMPHVVSAVLVYHAIAEAVADRGTARVATGSEVA